MLTAVRHAQIHVLEDIVFLVMVAVCGAVIQTNRLNDICDTATGKCTQGYKIGLRGDYCDKGKFTNIY
jgi:hypothetical protein